MFPDPDGQVTRDPKTGAIIVTLDYWLKITAYAIEVEHVRELVEAERAQR